METPPRLEDFGLTPGQYDRIPKLLRDRVSERFQARITVVAGAFIGLWTLWGFFRKVDGVFNGVFFGALIGFVAFLLASFLISIFIRLAIKVVSDVQRRLICLRNEKARQVFLFDDARRAYETAHAGDPGLLRRRQGKEG